MKALARPRGRSTLRYLLACLIAVASLTILYELRLFGQATRTQLSLDAAGSLDGEPGGEEAGVFPLDGSDLARIPNWRGKAGGGKPLKQPTQREKLAVLLPCWSDCPQASILVVYLSSLLMQQGIPFRIHVLEQVGRAAFNPGLLVNIGYQLAQRAEGGFAANYVAVQRATLTPYVNVSYAFPSSPFLHLAAEQSLYSNQVPYEPYCGGAWLAHVELFSAVGGLSAAYVGYDGLEDDWCRRVVAQLGSDTVPRVGPGHGRFNVIEDPVQQELSAMHRDHNRAAFTRRWGSEASWTEAEGRQDGLEGLPRHWPALLTATQDTDMFSWWRVEVPGSGEDRGDSSANGLGATEVVDGGGTSSGAGVISNGG